MAFRPSDASIAQLAQSYNFIHLPVVMNGPILIYWLSGILVFQNLICINVLLNKVKSQAKSP